MALHYLVRDIEDLEPLKVLLLRRECGQRHCSAGMLAEKKKRVTCLGCRRRSRLIIFLSNPAARGPRVTESFSLFSHSSVPCRSARMFAISAHVILPVPVLPVTSQRLPMYQSLSTYPDHIIDCHILQRRNICRPGAQWKGAPGKTQARLHCTELYKKSPNPLSLPPTPAPPCRSFFGLPKPPPPKKTPKGKPPRENPPTSPSPSPPPG